MDPGLLQWLVDAGIAGVVIVLILTGQLVTGREHKQLEKENERLKEALVLQRETNAEFLQYAVTGTKYIRAVAQVAEEQRQRTPPQGLPVLPPVEGT